MEFFESWPMFVLLKFTRNGRKQITDGDICLEAHRLIADVTPECLRSKEFLSSQIFQFDKILKEGKTICFQRNVLTPKDS